jgi:O-antigen/teichoic acid export membrane protein
MHRLARIALMTVRLCGLVLIVLGIIIWTSNAPALVPVHMIVGLIFVFALWCLAGVGTRAGVQMGITVRAVVWGFLVLIFGMLQRQMEPGPNHWYIRVLHLVIGLVAIGVAEMVGSRIQRSHRAEEPSV